MAVHAASPGAFWLLPFLALMTCDQPGQAEPPSPRPNVLFIVVDDLSCALSCYGHPMVKTPNIDQLAARGLRFDRAYCQYPLCNPSRASLLSGRRPDSTRIHDNNTDPRTHLKDVTFLPEHFRRHGYVTAGAGKIAHDRFPDSLVWDQSFSPRTEEALGVKKTDKPPQGQGRVLFRPTNPNLTPTQVAGATMQWFMAEGDDHEQPDGRTVQDAVRFLEKKHDKPFFLAVGFHRPHLPWTAPKRYFDLYPPDRIELPKAPANDRDDIPAPALQNIASKVEFTDQDRREMVRAYYASVSFMDAQVGKLLDALDRQRLADQSIVVFFSDHGYLLGEHGLWQKGNLFEEAARVPLIIAAPGMKAKGQSSERLAELVDLYPTLADLCGLPAPKEVEGSSLRPLLDEPKRAWKAAAFTQVQRGKAPGRSLRTERWRYTEWDRGEAGEELYDHPNDPQEFTNLAKDPKHAEVVKELRGLLRAGWKVASPK